MIQAPVSLDCHPDEAIRGGGPDEALAPRVVLGNGDRKPMASTVTPRSEGATAAMDRRSRRRGPHRPGHRGWFAVNQKQSPQRWRVPTVALMASSTLPARPRKENARPGIAGAGEADWCMRWMNRLHAAMAPGASCAPSAIRRNGKSKACAVTPRRPCSPSR